MTITDLGYLARELPVSERTLRRCAESGLIRARREGPRRLSIPPREQRYVRRHWPLLGALRALLRCERNVRMAVLYGSVARGTEGPGSDVDLLVSLGDPSIGRLAELSERLSDRLGREVHVARLHDAERAPSILAEALDEGRVVLDRDGDWSRLMRREQEIRRRAEREAAYRSGDPRQLNQALALERGFEVLHNYVVELVINGLILAGLRQEGESLDTPRDLRRAEDAGLISSRRRRRLSRAQRIRNRLQHEYASATPEQVHEGVKVIAAELPGFLDDYARWLDDLDSP